MILAKIRVNGVQALPVDAKHIPKGIIGGQIAFEYTDHMWDGLTKTVVFQGAVTKDVVNAGDLVTIPPEVVQRAVPSLHVGVYGTDAENNIAIPTLWADLGRIRAAADPSGDESTDESLPVWAQLQEQIDDLKENGTGSVDESVIREMVEDYLQENPPAAGKDGQDGEDGGYYTPAVTQPDSNTVQFAFTPSNADMPAVEPVQVALPDSGGNVDQSFSENAKSLLITILRNGVYSADQSDNITALAAELSVTEEEPDEPVIPDVPDEPDEPEVTLSNISATYSGGDVPVGTAVSALTGIAVTAYYSDGTSEAVTGYTLSGTITGGSNTVTVSYGGKTTTFTVVGVAVDVTSEYQEVEYIEFDGNSYIVTDEKGASNFGYTAEVEFPQSTTERCIVTLASTTVGATNVGHSSTAGRLFFYTGSADDTVAVTEVANLYTSKVKFTTDFKYNVERTLTVEVDGETYTSTGTATKSNLGNNKFVVGSSGYSTCKYGFIGKVYNAAYYAEGVLACDLMPCYRKSDGVIGMYDKVNGKFYTNAGTGTFVKGADVA